jgi:hypothetical protein
MHRRILLILIAVTWCGISVAVVHRRNIRAAHALECQAAEAGLYHVIPKIDLDDAPLAEAIDRIANAGRVKINVRWDSLKRVGVRPEARVRVSMQGYTVERVLDVVLAAAQRDDEIAYEADEQGITVAAARDLPPIVRMYDVRHLAAPNQPATPTIASQTQTGISNQLFANPGFSFSGIGRVVYDVQRGASLSAYLQGVEQMPCYGWSGRLIVIGTRERHRRAARLLRDLRSIYSNADGTRPRMAGDSR